jgi:tape measure domain-containing protein
MPEAISISALLRLQTKTADAYLKLFAQKSKPLELKVKFKADEVSKSFADITAVAISSKIKTSFGVAGDDLVKKIEEAFSKSKVKSSGGGILGGLTNIVTAPLQGLARGAFEGVGREVSRKFGVGLSKGLESQISEFVGGSDFFAEKLVTKIVPDLSKTAIAKIKATSLGKQLAEAMKDLDVEAARDNLKQRFRDLLGDSDLLIEQEFNRSQKSKVKSQKRKTAQKEVAGQLQNELKLQPQTELRSQAISKQIEALEKQSRAERTKLGQIATIAKPSPANVKQVEVLINNLKSREKEIKLLQQEQKKLFNPVAQEKLAKLGVNTKSVDIVIGAVDRATESAKKALDVFKQSETTLKQDVNFAQTELPKHQERLAKLQQAAKEALSDNDIALARAIAAKIVDSKTAITELQQVIEQSADKLKTVIGKQAELSQTIDSDREQKLILSLQQQIEIIQNITGKSASEISKAIAIGQQQTLNKVIENARKQAQKNVQVIEGAIAKGSTVSESAIKQGESEIATTALGKLIAQRKEIETSTQQLLKEKAQLIVQRNQGQDVDELLKKVETDLDTQIKQLTEVRQSLQKAESENFADYQKVQEIESQRGIFEAAVRAAQNIDQARKAVENIELIGDQEFERLNKRLQEIVVATESVTKKSIGKSQSAKVKTEESVSESQKIVNAIADEVSRISKVGLESIPKVVEGINLPEGALGSFDPATNQLALSKELFNQLQNSQISEQLSEVIVHELRHALQQQVAKTKAELEQLLASGQFILEPTQTERSQLQSAIDFSVNQVDDPNFARQRKIFEEDAYTFTHRYLDEISKNVGVVQTTGLTKLNDELKKLLSQVKPPDLPKTPAISSRAFPVIDNSNDLETLLNQQISASGLREIVKRLGLGTDSPVKKVAIERIVASYKQDALKVQELIGRLGDEIKVKSSKTGSGSSLGKIEDEPALTEAFKANRRILGEAFKQLETLSGDQREVLAKQINAIAAEQIQAIDRVSREFKVAGKTGQSLSGSRSQFAAIYDKELLNNPKQYIDILKDSAIAKSQQNLQEKAKQVGNKVSQAVENILENTRERLTESLQQIERAALPERQQRNALPAAKTGEIVKSGSTAISTQAQVINTVSSLAIRAIADITATSKSAYEQAQALEKLVFDLVPFTKVAKTGIQAATPVIAGGALISQSPEIAQAAKFAAENLADVIQPLIAALRAGGANAIGDLVGQIPGIGGVSQAVIKGLLNNPAFNAQIAEGLANITTVAGIGAGAIKGGKAAVSKASQSAFKALPESLQDRLTPESITAFDSLVAQRQKEINVLARDVQQNISAIASTQDPAKSKNLLTGYAQVTQQIEELEKFSVKAGIETLKRTKDRLNQLRKVQQGLKDSIPDVTVERVIQGDSDNLKNIGDLYSGGSPRNDVVKQVVNKIADAVEAEIADTVIKTIGNIVKSPSGRDLSKEVAVNGVGFVAGKTAIAASGGIPGVGLAAEYGASTITRKAVTDIESTLDALATVLNNGTIDTNNKLELFIQVLAEATTEARRKSAATRINLDKDTAGFAIGNIAAATSQSLGANIPLIGAATAIATTNPALAIRDQILSSIDIKTLVPHIIDGLSSGVTENLTLVATQGQRLAEELLEGFRDRLGIKSPAKEFIKDMQFVALGIVAGAEHNLRQTFKAGKRLGDELAVGFAKSNIAEGKIADKAAKQIEKQVKKLEQENDRTTNSTIKRIEQNLRRVDQVVNSQSTKLDRSDVQQQIADANRIAQTQTRVFKNQGIGSAPIQSSEEQGASSNLVSQIKTAIASIQNDLRNSGLEKATKEAQKVVLASKDLLANLNVTVTVGRDAGEKIRQANAAIAVLEKEQAAAIKGIGNLSQEERTVVQAQVQRIQSQIAEEKERVAALKAQQTEAKELIPVYQQLTKLNHQLQQAIANQDTRSIRRLNREINQVHESLNQPPPGRGNGFLDKLNLQLERVGITSQRIKSTLAGLAAVAIGSLFVGDFTDVIRDISEVTVRFEQLETQINFAAGSSREGAKNFAFISADAKRLKTDIEEAAKGYATLSNATKSSEKLKGETDSIFKVINQASRVTGGTAQQTEAAFLAIQQMVSGGTLQLEELRQLGESGGIKGVFDIAQEALGAADGELKKLISTGTIAVDDFLPKFIKQLDLATRSGVAGALDTTAAAIINVKNEYKSLQVAIGKTSEGTAKFALNAIAASLELVRNNLDLILPVLKTTATLVAIALLPTVVSLVKVVGGFLIKGLGQVVGLLATTNTQLLATNIQLQLLATTSPRLAATIAMMNKLAVAAKLLGTAFLALGAVVVLQQVAEAFTNTKNAGQEARDAVDEINNSMIELHKTLTGIGKTQLLPEDLTRQIAEENKKALLEQQNFAQKAVDGLINNIPGAGKILTTYADAATSRIVAATGDVIFANQKLLAEADNKLGLGDVTNKATDELQAYADAISLNNQSLQKTIDTSVDPNQIQQLNAELNQNQKRLERYNAELNRRGGLELNLARIALARNESVEAATKTEINGLASIDEEILRSGDFKKDIELQKLQYAQTRINAELAAEKLASSQILALAANGAGLDANGKPKKAQELEEYEKSEKRILELTRSSIENRQALMAKEIEQKVAEYDRYLEKVEKSRQKAEDTAIASEKERLIELQQLYNDDLISKETLEDLKADLQFKRIKGELDQEQLKLQKLEQFSSSEKEVREKADEEIKTSKNKILDLTLELLQQEKEAEERTIEAIAAAREKAYSALENRLSKLQQIYQTEANLISDRNASEEKLGELQVSKLRQALELRKQLNSGDLNQQERSTAIKQLYSLGIEGRSSELSLLNQIEDKEKAIAQKKLDSLLVQQEFARKQLDIENQQLVIATNKAKIEAEKGQLEARKDVNSAEQAIAVAETPEELKQANKIYDLAKDSLDLANQDVELSKQQVDNLDDIIKRKKENLDLSQKIALAEAKSTNVDEEFAREKEKDEAKESRDRRRVASGEASEKTLDKYKSSNEKIAESEQRMRELMSKAQSDSANESPPPELIESSVEQARKKAQSFENQTAWQQEASVIRSLLGNPGFTIEASPNVLDRLRRGVNFSVPQVSPLKSTQPLQLDTLGKTKGSLSEDNMILKTLQNIESKFKQPTVIQVQNDNQFTNVYDKSSADEVPRMVRSEMTDMLNQLGNSLR